MLSNFEEKPTFDRVQIPDKQGPSDENNTSEENRDTKKPLQKPNKTQAGREGPPQKPSKTREGKDKDRASEEENKPP